MVARRWPTCISDSRGQPRVRIQKQGRVVFSQTLNVNINTKSGLAQAVRLRDQVKSRLLLGLPANVNDSSAKHLFNEAAQSYMNQLGGSITTHVDYESIINSWWLPVFNNRILEELTTRDIREVLGARNVSCKRKSNALTVLRGILDLFDVIPNPADFKIKNTDQKVPKVRYTPEERHRLLSFFQGGERVYFALLFGCGLRPCGEVFGLEWSAYNGQELNINKVVARRQIKATTKTYVARKVIVPDWVKPILDNHSTRFQGGHILLNDKGTYFKDANRFNASWKAAHKKLKIPYRVPYVCRHTRAAELLSTGIEPAEGAAQLGHSLRMFLDIYSEFIEEYSAPKDPSRFNGMNPNIEQLPPHCPEGKVISIT
jgi:integrase